MNGQLSIIQTQSSFFIPTLQTFSNMIVASADDGVEVSMMDFETVENIDNALVAAHGLSRSCLYWMREKKGYLILGFESFEKYGEARFGFSIQHLNRLANAHAIQNVIEPVGSKEISESVLRPLGQVVSDTDKKKIWDEATAKAESENKKVTAKMIEEAVARHKLENETLQHELICANKKLASVETIDVESILNAEIQKVESEMQARFDAVQDKLSKAINDKLKLENQIKDAGTTDVETAKAELEKLNREIEAQQARKDELNYQLEQTYNDRNANEEINTNCETLREQMALVMAQLHGVKGVAKNLYEETNAQIHGTAEMLEQFAEQLRHFATDNAEFSMI